jgi:hypothetical protein
MKRSLFLFLLIYLVLGATPSLAQRLMDGSRRTVGYIEGERVINTNRSTIGYLDGSRVMDGSRRTIGYVEDGRVINSSRSSVGYIQDGRVMDQSRRTIGYIEDGRVMDSSRRIIGYYEGVRITNVALFSSSFFIEEMGLGCKVLLSLYACLPRRTGLCAFARKENRILISKKGNGLFAFA